MSYEASCFYDSCPKDGLVSRWSLWDECATNLVGVVLGREAVAAGRKPAFVSNKCTLNGAGPTAFDALALHRTRCLQALGPGGGSRTLMPLRTIDFESIAYAIPPLRAECQCRRVVAWFRWRWRGRGRCGGYLRSSSLVDAWTGLVRRTNCARISGGPAADPPREPAPIDRRLGGRRC